MKSVEKKEVSGVVIQVDVEERRKNNNKLVTLFCILNVKEV
jgi:hypothetical protein